MPNAVIYARYSCSSQTERSIEGQLLDCHAYADRIGVDVIGEYIDRAISGTTDDRPDFQRMIEDSGKKFFQFVIVWKLDRFARSRYDSAIYKTRLKKNGVKVLSAQENIGDGDEAIILEAILEASAEYYSADLSKKVKRGLRETCSHGTFTGGRPPLGYTVVDHKMVIDPKTGPIMQQAFRMYAAGAKRREVMALLNDSGLRNKRGKPFGMTSLQAAFHNRKYIGEYRHGEHEVVGGCPALIDVDTFDKVQQRLASVRHAPAAEKARTDYKLQGRAFCGMCGEHLVGESGRGKMGVVYSYYACSNRKKKHTCVKLNEKKDFLEWYVVEQTQLYVLTPERISYIASEVVKRNQDDSGPRRIEALEEKVQNKENEIRSSVELLIHTTSDRTRQQLDQAIDRLCCEKDDLEKDIATLRLASRFQLTVPDVEAWLQSFCNGDPLDDAFQSRIIDTFVNSVYVYDDKIVIYYNISGGKQVSWVEMLDSTTEPAASDPGSDLTTCSPQYVVKSETSLLKSLFSGVGQSETN